MIDNEEKIEPMSSDLLDLVRAGRDVPHMDDAFVDRLGSRLDATLSLGVAGTAGVAAKTTAATAAANATLAAKHAGLVALSKTTVAMMLAAAATSGAVIGVSAMTALREPEVRVERVEVERVVWRDRPVQVQPVVETPPPVQESLPSNASKLRSVTRVTVVAPAATEVAPTTVPTVDARSTDDAQRTAERLLLDRAQTALARSRANDALVALEEHAHRFSNGWLAEERDALWIKALASADQMDAARTRATRFLAAHPRSAFRGLVEQATAL